MTAKDQIDMINDLEERIEILERNHKGFASNMIIVLTYLLPETPERIKLRKENIAKVKMLFQDRDFDFEKEKVIQNFLKGMQD